MDGDGLFRAGGDGERFLPVFGGSPAFAVILVIVLPPQIEGAAAAGSDFHHGIGKGDPLPQGGQIHLTGGRRPECRGKLPAAGLHGLRQFPDGNENIFPQQLRLVYITFLRDQPEQHQQCQHHRKGGTHRQPQAMAGIFPADGSRQDQQAV